MVWLVDLKGHFQTKLILCFFTINKIIIKSLCKSLYVICFVLVCLEKKRRKFSQNCSKGRKSGKNVLQSIEAATGMKIHNGKLSHYQKKNHKTTTKKIQQTKDPQFYSSKPDISLGKIM